MIKKWLLLKILVLGSACTISNNTKYYHLPVPMSATIMPSYLTVRKQDTNSNLPIPHINNEEHVVINHHLFIAQISVADFLAGNGIVYQTNDIQYTTATNNLWASPLEQQLKQALVANLSTLLPDTLVSTFTTQKLVEQYKNNDILTVTITGFHGRFDGHAINQGEWLLIHNGFVIRQPFNLVLLQDKDGYDALVRVLAQSWQMIGQQIATIYKSLSF